MLIRASKDAYTDGGVSDGSPLKPAVLIPPNPMAGGRVSNGPVWVENLAASAGASLKDYAVGLNKHRNLYCADHNSMAGKRSCHRHYTIPRS